MTIKMLTTVMLLAALLPATPLYGDVNVLVNPGFENGTADWIARSCSISSVTSPVHGGSYSARAYNRNAVWQGIQQDMIGKMVPGETYQISGWMRLENASSETVKVTVQQTDGDGTKYHGVDSATASNSGWIQLSGNFTLTVDGTLTELYVYFEGPGNDISFFVDDAVVYGPEPGSIDVAATINVNTRHQMIEGIGAAGAWYTSTLVNHPSKNTLYDLLFNQLSLDIYRIRDTYQIESGTVTDSVEIIQQGEAALGRPLKIMISSWSPPANLKSNDNTREGTLKKDGNGNYMYAEFADWWADSLDHYASLGVVPEYINIQNEPDYTNSGWDTCQLNPTESTEYAGYNLAFEAVWQELNSRMGSNMPKMLASEATGFSSIGNYIDNLINDSHVYGYAHHLYNCSNGGEAGCGDEPDRYITNMGNFNAQYGTKPLFQTEYEYLAADWSDAVNTALLLHNSLSVEEVAAYMYWDLFWGSSSGDGLISMTSSSYTINPVYWGFKHYSAFIDSGWQRVGTSTNSSDLRISAYINPDNQQVSVMLINTNALSAIEADLSFTGFSIANGNIHRSTSSENCLNVGSFDAPGPLTIPANSIITLSLSGKTIYPDFDGNNFIDLSDLTDFMDYWLLEECIDLDLNNDCRINLYEFSELARNWLDDSFQ